MQHQEPCVWLPDRAMPSLTLDLVMLMLRHAAQLLPPSFRLQDQLMCCFYDTCLSCFLPFSFHSVSVKSWFWLFIIRFNKADFCRSFQQLEDVFVRYLQCEICVFCDCRFEKKWSLALHEGLISFAWMFWPPLAFFQFPAAPTGSFLSSLSPDFSFPGSHGLGFSSRSMIHTPSWSMAVSYALPGPNTPPDSQADSAQWQLPFRPCSDGSFGVFYTLGIGLTRLFLLCVGLRVFV